MANVMVGVILIIISLYMMLISVLVSARGTLNKVVFKFLPLVLGTVGWIVGINLLGWLKMIGR